MNLLYMAIAWAAGIYVAWSVPHAGGAWPFLVIVGMLVAILLRRDVAIRRAGLCLFAAGLGMWRLTSSLPNLGPSALAAYNDQQTAELAGIVADDPELRDQTTLLRLEVDSIRPFDQSPREVHGLALVYADRAQTYQYGDRVRMYGLPQTPTEFDTFSFRDYLARQGVYTVVYRPRVSILSHDQGSPILAALFRVKASSRALLTRLLPEPGSALLRGILLGDDSGLSPEVTDAFRATNTSHLIAISGANIAVVVALLMGFFEHLPGMRKWLAALLTVAGIALYTLFVGASPGVVRAAIMGSFAIIASRLGRRADGLTALAASVWALTLLNPLSLFDLGLILSALATFGLVAYLPAATRFTEAIIARLLSAETARRVIGAVADTLLIGLVAQIATLPVILLISRQSSPLSIPVNVLVAPVQPLIMTLGIPALIAGLVWFPLGQILGWLVGLPVFYTLAIIRAAAALNWSTPIEVTPTAVVAYYILLFGFTAVLSPPAKRRQQILDQLRGWLPLRTLRTLPVALAGAGVVVLLWAAVAARPDGKLHVWFLSVGEGSATLIRTPGGAYILVDGGDSPTRLLTAIGDHLPFYQRSLDLLVVTEPKPVVSSALDQVLARYTVSTVITNGQPLSDVLQTALAKSSAQVVAASAGYTVQSADGVIFEVLNPPALPPPDARPDEAPLILRVRYGAATFLLTSDIAEKGIQSALKSGVFWGATVALLPSNGTDRSNPPDWLARLSPQVAVITAQTGERAAQPAPRVLDWLANTPLYRTDQHGTIEIATDGQQLWISARQ